MWQPLTEPSVEDVHRVLTEVDVALWSSGASRTSGNCSRADRSGAVHHAEGRLIAVAGSVPDEECVMGIVAAHPGRSELLSDAVPLLEDVLRAGGALWLPTLDHDAGAAAAAAHGLVRAYTDLQMRTRTTAASASPPPLGTRLRELGAAPSGLHDVHDLVCAAWGAEDHWTAFHRRFEQAAREPALWVLLESEQGELVAACFGDGQDLADGRFKVVRHLDVAPGVRRSGLGRWALNELLVRFALAGWDEAQLGVHGDNASGAPAFYRSHGWSVVSSQDKWVRAPPSPAPGSRARRRGTGRTT